MDSSSPRSPHKVPARRYVSSFKSPRSKPLLPSPPQSPSTHEPPTTPTTALPPLVHGAGAPSPRLTRDAVRMLRPLALPLQLDHDYPVAQLDNWPLTATTTRNWNSPLPTSPRQEMPSPHATSPLSPRVRKANARHRLFDDCKSKPLLLQELYAFATAELGAMDAPRSRDSEMDVSASSPPNLQRLQVFRELFGRVIESFSVYAPLLAQIKDEYEAAVRHLLAKCQLIPQLHGELQSLEAQCLQQLSQHQIETKLKHKALRQMLKDTQARLAACAAENAHLKDANRRVNEEFERLEKRYEDMHQSNHSLVNGMRRHDDTLRHIHERSREEGMALQQMTLKYHRACDEIAELKKTVASLEEKVGGVHVAADKATIALLTKDLQEMHSKLQTHPSDNASDGMSQDHVLRRILVGVLEHNGISSTEPQLLDMVKSHGLGTNPSSTAQVPLATTASVASLSSKVAVPSTASSTKPVPPRPLTSPLAGLAMTDILFGIDRVASALSDQIALFHQQSYQLAFRASQHTASSTFLTEPTERVSFGSQTLAPLVATTDLIPTCGTDSSVPDYLQYDGVVRNLYYDRKRVEVLIAKAWAYKDDLEGKAKRQNSTHSPSKVLLAQAFGRYLQRCFPSSRHDQVECAYNVVTALDRFALGSSDCRLFKLVLERELPDDARVDQAKELAALHDTLASMHREHKTSNQGRAGGSGLPLAEVVRALRREFPWKSDAQLSRLHNALLVDMRGHALVDFAALFQHVDDGANRRPHTGPRTKSQFVEALRAQYIDDSLAFRRYLQSHVTIECIAGEKSGTGVDGEGSNASGMVAVRVLRECLQRCDLAKPVQEINRLLTVATGLSMDQILTHDSLMVSATQFVATLPTLLVKPSGKFGDDVVTGDTARANS